jgi:hypothetical protein
MHSRCSRPAPVQTRLSKSLRYINGRRRYLIDLHGDFSLLAFGASYRIRPPNRSEETRGHFTSYQRATPQAGSPTHPFRERSFRTRPIFRRGSASAFRMQAKFVVRPKRVESSRRSTRQSFCAGVWASVTSSVRPGAMSRIAVTIWISAGTPAVRASARAAAKSSVRSTRIDHAPKARA